MTVQSPLLGLYIGTAKDVTSPGDDVTYQLLLNSAKRTTFEAIPKLSYFRGGQPPWLVEGNWEADEDEVTIAVTKQDVTGPRKDTDLILLRNPDSTLTYRRSNATLVWKEPPPDADPMAEKKDILTRMSAEAEAKQAELDKKADELRKEREMQEAKRKVDEEELERLRQELKSQREAQAAAAAKAEEERLRLEAEAEAKRLLLLQEAEKESLRIAAEAEEDRSRLAKEAEERRKEAEERQALAQKQLEDARLEHERQDAEAQRQLEEQKQAMLDQQRMLEEQRRVVEDTRAMDEAERASKLEKVKQEEAELRRKQEEFEKTQAQEEALRKAEAEEAMRKEEELREQAATLRETENVLSQERQHIVKSRQTLATVQAHVVSMLSSNTKLGENAATINMDACDEPEAELDSVDDGADGGPDRGDVWDMDWSAVAGRQPEEEHPAVTSE